MLRYVYSFTYFMDPSPRICADHNQIQQIVPLESLREPAPPPPLRNLCSILRFDKKTDYIQKFICVSSLVKLILCRHLLESDFSLSRDPY